MSPSGIHPRFISGLSHFSGSDYICYVLKNKNNKENIEVHIFYVLKNMKHKKILYLS